MTPLIVNFHGIGQRPDHVTPAEQPFWISEQVFADVLDALSSAVAPFEVTFDDGNLSDFSIGVPACVRRGIPTKVFVCSNRIGQPGYLGANELRRLAALPLCEIGSHGADHLSWPGLDRIALTTEIEGSRQIIEDTIGMAVRSAGIPFGAYNRKVLAALKRAGYSRMYTSDGGPRLIDSMVIPRATINTLTPIEHQIAQILQSFSIYRATINEFRMTIKSLV